MNRLPMPSDTQTASALGEWVKELDDSGLMFHFDDDPRTVMTTVDGRMVRTFTDDECDELEDLIECFRSSLGDDFDSAAYDNLFKR